MVSKFYVGTNNKNNKNLTNKFNKNNDNDNNNNSFLSSQNSLNIIEERDITQMCKYSVGNCLNSKVGNTKNCIIF